MRGALESTRFDTHRRLYGSLGVFRSAPVVSSTGQLSK